MFIGNSVLFVMDLNFIEPSKTKSWWAVRDSGCQSGVPINIDDFASLSSFVTLLSPAHYAFQVSFGHGQGTENHPLLECKD
jgi:hypothetical protein